MKRFFIFQKVPEVVPELMKRFEVLIMDDNYPWLDNMCSSNGLTMFNAVVEAYKYVTPSFCIKLLYRFFF